MWLESRSIFTQKSRTFSSPDFLKRFEGDVVNFLDIVSLDLLPFTRLKHLQRERINFSGRAADAVGVVFHDKEHRKLRSFAKQTASKKSPCRVAASPTVVTTRFFFSSSLIPQAMPQAGKKLRAGGRGHAPNVQAGVAVMRWHLPAAAAGIALGKIFESKFARRHAASENKAAIAVVGTM